MPSTGRPSHRQRRTARQRRPEGPTRAACSTCQQGPMYVSREARWQGHAVHKAADGRCVCEQSNPPVRADGHRAGPEGAGRAWGRLEGTDVRLSRRQKVAEDGQRVAEASAKGANGADSGGARGARARGRECTPRRSRSAEEMRFSRPSKHTHDRGSCHYRRASRRPSGGQHFFGVFSGKCKRPVSGR